jgi:hypothetical protein
MIKSRRMRWAGNFGGKKLLGKCRREWEHIKMECKETG